MTVFVNMKDNDDNSTMGVATQVDWKHPKSEYIIFHVLQNDSL